MRKYTLQTATFFIFTISLLLGESSYIFSQVQKSSINYFRKEAGTSENAKDSISILCRLCWETNWNNPSQTFRYGMRVLGFIGKEKDKEQLAEIYDAAALAYWVKGEFRKAEVLYKKALDLGHKYNLPVRIAWENFNLAGLLSRELRFSEARKYAEKSKASFQRLNDSNMVIQSDQLINNTYVNSNLGIESLKQSLSLVKTADDSVAIYNRFIWFNKTAGSEELFKCRKEVLELTGRVKDKLKLSESFDAVALTYLLESDLVKAKEFYNKALKVANRYNLSLRIAWENFNLSNLSEREGKIHEAEEEALISRAEFKKNDMIERVIDRDWFLIKIFQNKNNELIDSTIEDIKFALNRVNDPDKLLNYYFNIIYLYDQKENKSKSIYYAMKTLEKAEEVDNRKAILKAYFQIADYLRDYQKNYEVALLYYDKILTINKEIGDKIGIAGVLNDIGKVQKLLGNESAALDYFNKSLDIAEKVNHKHSISNAYRNIAEIYYLRKDYGEALKYFMESYNTGCDICPKIRFHSVLINIGKVYLNEKDYKNALKYFNKGLKLADSAKANYETSVSHLAIADLYRALNNATGSGNHYHTALIYAKDANSLSLQREIAAKLSSVYKDQNNFGKAYEYLKLSDNIADSLKKISDVENLSRLETKFEFQKIKNQLNESKIKAELEINRQSELKNLFIAAFLFVTILGIVIYSSYRRKKKDSVLLEKQKIQMEEMSEKVHQADQKKLNFFSNISHEFRTPLTLILGPVERLLKNDSSNGKDKPLLNIIYRNTLQLYNLINQLLEIRKLDTGNIKLRVSKKDIMEYLKGLYSAYLHMAEENQIGYHFNCADEKIICWFDSDILEKVLNNLLSNAFKYTPLGGEINFSVSAVHKNQNEISEVMIIVSDNGKGIPEDQLRYIFDRYFQVENINDGFNTGTGIGLAYTKELIEVHKGEINVESKINSGTSFSIKLPVNDSFYAAEEKTGLQSKGNKTENESIMLKYLSAHGPLKPEEKNNGNSKENLINTEIIGEENPILLIVEDNDDLREFIKSIFSDSYKIYEAADGVEGYAIANKIIPNIIISDIMMPRMNGLELCNKLKKNIHTNHIPVLILTAKTGEENEITGLKTGADDYLTKPFHSEILKIRINRLIESKEILKEYFTRNFLLKPKEIKPSSPEDEFLLKAVKVVENNITNPDLNVELMMNELAVSRTQLFRKLKAITNYSANQFIRNIKLKRAAQLLQDKSNNVTDVVYLSGFNSPSYFSACFKEMYGCLPREYQEKNQNIPSRISI